MLMIYRCILCRSHYLGTEQPSHCPSCGGYSRFLVKAGKDDDIGKMDHKDLLKFGGILKEKMELITLYNSNVTQFPILKHLYSSLKSVDQAHIDLLHDMGIPNKPLGDVKLNHYEEDNLTEVFNRKSEIVDMWNRLVLEDKNVKLLATGLHEVDEDHVRLLEEYVNNYG